jgi:predicted transcriptional regulator of viral defense system
MRDSGLIEQVARGIYRLKGNPQAIDVDFGTLALKVPTGVVCLITALYYHGMTTQIPRFIDMAIERNTKPPRIDYPPVRFYRLSKHLFNVGVETKEIGGVKIRIYDPEKTLIDCFRYRRRIGIDVVIEALKAYRSQKHIDVAQLLKYARVFRIEDTLNPYLESIL